MVEAVGDLEAAEDLEVRNPQPQSRTGLINYTGRGGFQQRDNGPPDAVLGTNSATEKYMRSLQTLATNGNC